MEENKNNYLLGILGALIGGFVASIPWILMYVYGEMILSLLAIIIAIGALKGYQIFKGKIDNKLPIIISVISIIVIIVATLIIIPLLLLNQNGLDVTYSNFNALYSYGEFKSAIFKDLLISIVFTILGISGVIANIKKQLREEKNPTKIKITSNSEVNELRKRNLEIAKKAFIKLKAMDKKSAVYKDDIISAMGVDEAKQIFNTLKLQQIIRRYKGKYYFSERSENSTLYRFGILYGKTLLVILVIVILYIIIFLV